jgi:DNA-directed RNA polymerase subunit RPC12/RpoP
MASKEYWAGFFDGEGSIHINKIGGVQVAVTQKKVEVLKELVSQYGGQIYSKHRKYSDISNWKVNNRSQIINFLTDIAPYSIVKKEEIALGLKAAYLLRKVNVGCNPLSHDEMQERMDNRYAMQKLRPRKLFQNTLSLESQYRDEVKKQHNYKCHDCGKDLKELGVLEQLIRDGVLICRKCNGKRTTKEHRPLTREQIEDALKTTKTLEDACKKLGVVRCTLYKKRKKLGMPLRYDV